MKQRFTKFGLLLCLAAAGWVAASAQKESPKQPPSKPDSHDKAKAPQRPPRTPTPAAPPEVTVDSIERVLPADPAVAIKLCVAEGEIKINGTEANELRVFVRNGRKFEFRSLEKNPESGKANWVWITRAAPPGTAAGPASQCLAGDSVEIDMPAGGNVTLEARTAGAVVDSVRKASVRLVEGSISLRNIPYGVNAVVLQGDVMVESSSGPISLETTSGDIIAFDVKPGNVGDLLKARTNRGGISLQNVSHRQVEASAITGAVSFNGKFLPGGIYSFKTSSGPIRMLLPDDTSCKVVASFGFGNFESKFPMRVLSEDVSSGGKRVVGTIGKGDTTTVNLTTSTGAIGIRRLGAMDLP